MKLRIALLVLLVCGSAMARKKQDNANRGAASTGLDQYVQEAIARAGQAPAATPGAIYVSGQSLFDLGSDLRARHVDDVVTVLVVERASAVASGNLTSSRQSSVDSSISSLAGPMNSSKALANLAKLGSTSKIDGAASTSRETTVSTTLSARVVAVLPNGQLVIEGDKEVQLNSERQTVSVRGVARPMDITNDNIIRSDRLAQLEVRVNGKGVVGDAIKRPFFLYRLLLGILPF